METKICTSIEQSKKLLSLGLDADTADMWYLPIKDTYELVITPSLTRGIIPAWSLSALLELMPILLKGYWRWILTRHNRGYSCTYLNGGETFHSKGGKTDIDAAYNMVVYLLEQGYIKTEK